MTKSQVTFNCINLDIRFLESKHCVSDKSKLRLRLEVPRIGMKLIEKIY